MNRPIKFRYRYEQTNKLTGEKIIVTRIYDMSQIEDGIAKVYFDCEKLISRDEFTRLHDKNGKPIFEGDRVRWSTYDGYQGDAVVEFRDGRFYPVSLGSEPTRYDDKGFEVTGDIFTTPELLEGSNENRLSNPHTSM